jgi:hypothetical protein
MKCRPRFSLCCGRRSPRKATGLVTEFTCDYRNRVTDIVVKDAQGNVVYRTHYIYDVFDRRIATEVDADGDGPQQPVRTWTFYDGDNPYIDLDDQGNVQHYYLYGPDIDQVLARLDPATETYGERTVTGSCEYPITLTSSGGRDRHLCRANYNCQWVA